LRGENRCARGGTPASACRSGRRSAGWTSRPSHGPGWRSSGFRCGGNMSLAKDFKEFLLKQNALALAVGVVIGAAVGKVVSALVEDMIMPFVGLLLPGGEWRSWLVPPTHRGSGEGGH